MTLLKNAEFIIGNSSAGIRESSVYAIPDIDIGTRQNRRYSLFRSKNIQHVDENRENILMAIQNAQKYRIAGSQFGNGCSAEMFVKILKEQKIWATEIQKKFVDFNM